MNFNYDLATWIDYFIGAFVCCFGMFTANMILFYKNFKDIKKIRYLLLIPYTIFIVFNTLAFDNVLKIFGVYFGLVLMNKYIIEEKNNKILIYSFISYVILMFSEMLYALIVSLFNYIFNNFIITIVTKTIYANMFILIITCIIAYLMRNKISTFVDKVYKINFWITFLQCVLTVFVIIASINFLYIEKFRFNYKFILIFIIICGSIILSFTLMKQHLKSKEVENKYNMLQEYLKTSADLIEKYSSTLHRYKNNLIIIKGYLKTDVNEGDKYIDGLLDKFENRKYNWVNKINKISIDSIKYIIYYKLSKAEELNLKIFVNVSRDIIDFDNKYFKANELGHILDILGEYFDNAIYASHESKEKELNFDLYKTEDEIVFNISNTYKGNIDLNLITKNGYTTKGKGHGFGLYDIDKTIKSINILSNKYELLDKYFITTLKVKIQR